MRSNWNENALTKHKFKAKKNDNKNNSKVYKQSNRIDGIYRKKKLFP